jgi:hypothetical protein
MIQYPQIFSYHVELFRFRLMIVLLLCFEVLFNLVPTILPILGVLPENYDGSSLNE